MRIPGKEITRRGRTETSKRAVAALSPTILSWSCVMSSKLTRAVARRGTAEGEVSSTKGSNLIVSRPEKGRIADTAEKERALFFVAVGFFGVSAISLRLSWPLISVSNGGEETPLVSGTVDACTHDGYRPPRLTHGVTPTRETAQKDEPKGAIRTHPQAEPPVWSRGKMHSSSSGELETQRPVCRICWESTCEVDGSEEFLSPTPCSCRDERSNVHQACLE